MSSSTASLATCLKFWRNEPERYAGQPTFSSGARTTCISCRSRVRRKADDVGRGELAVALCAICSATAEDYAGASPEPAGRETGAVDTQSSRCILRRSARKRGSARIGSRIA
jgi:hypothetical protein